MTQRRRLMEQMTRLSESGEIIRSMKNLAFMETRRLSQFIEHQRNVVKEIETIADDFLSFHPYSLTAAEPLHQAWLIIGSKRGFCGDFNERLIRQLEQAAKTKGSATSSFIGVGQKLCRSLSSTLELSAGFDGADVAEEIPATLRVVVAELDRLRARHGALELAAVHWMSDAEVPVVTSLLPPFPRRNGSRPQHTTAPALNLRPQLFLLDLGEQYLYAALYAVFYESLLAENERRVRHLDGAVGHLEQRLDALRRRSQALRQEEIIEEIEVILLNAAELDDTGDVTGVAR